jgi:hypothetical protein
MATLIFQEETGDTKIRNCRDFSYGVVGTYRINSLYEKNRWGHFEGALLP